MVETQYINSNNKKLAYKNFIGNYPKVLYIAGHTSTMSKLNSNNSTASGIYDVCNSLNIDFTAFDYAGWGESEGEEKVWNLDEWIINCCDMIDNMEGRFVLVGSSMGGYLSLLMASLYPDRVEKIILNVPGFGASYLETGRELNIKDPNEKIVIDLELDDEEKSLIASDLNINCPVYIFRGLNDDVVSSKSAETIISKLSTDVEKEIYDFAYGHKGIFCDNKAQDILKEILSK